MMLEMLRLFYYVINTLIIITIICQLLDVKLNFKKSIIINLSILVVYLSMIFLFGTIGLMKNNILVLIIIIFFRLYKVSYIFPIFVCSIITTSTTLMLNDMFTKSLITFMNISSSDIYYNPLKYALVSVVFFIIDLIILFLLKHYKIVLFEDGQIFNYGRLNNSIKYSKKTFFIYDRIILVIIAQIWLLTIYFTINDITILNPSSQVQSLQQNFITLIIGSAIIILNIIAIFMLKNITILTKEQYQLKLKEKEFAQIQHQDSINRQFKHDLTNHFKLLKILAKQERYQELNNYLDNYEEVLKSNSINVKTGLVELDILLNSKIDVAQMKNITIKYKCTANIICEKKHIINMISVMGNVMDNAIEASEESDKKLIDIEIKEDVLDYVFTIKNSTNNKELHESNTLLQEGYSTKGHDRGYGLIAVKRIVKKYDGVLNITSENNIFIIRFDLTKSELSKGE